MSTDCLRNGFVPNILLDSRFQTVSPLNHGSFGMVFLAKDITNGELVAIKCVAKANGPMPATGLAPAPDHLLELACYTRLGSYPNIVNMIYAFEDASHMFIVLEFCPMGDLYEAIRLGRGPLETEHVRSFMLQLVDAVEFMHAKGLYHRDIKPENILIAQDGSLKLGDFGLSTTETWSNEISVGSDRYMAPEQYDPAEGGYSPAQADIWAIGICLLNILFARNPFVTPSEEDVLFRDFANDKQSLFDIFPALSQDTFEVLEHSLAMDPAKRSLTEMRKALGRVLSFTADDDIFDEFCVEERDVVPASANRQPLRTPSIQSPPCESNGMFPWSRTLHLSPGKASRQLSAIPDKEYEEELFPEPQAVPVQGAVPNASIDSLIDSALGESIKSMKLHAPQPRNGLFSGLSDTSRRGSAAPQNVTGSLPVTASKPMRALSMIFGKKDKGMSKSWSDMLDEEDDDDDDFSPSSALDKNAPFEPANNWSTDSLGIELEPHDADVTPKPSFIQPSSTSESKSVPIPGATPRPRSRTPLYHLEPESPSFGGDSGSEDISSFEEKPPAPIYKLPLSSDVYSPPAKRGEMDKWAALGNKRRAFKSTVDLKQVAREPSRTLTQKNRTRSNTALPDPPRRERKNTGGSWRRGEDSGKESPESTKKENGVISFGKKMGSAFGFGDRQGGFGFGRNRDRGNNLDFQQTNNSSFFNVSNNYYNNNANNRKFKDIPKHDMVRIVDWRKGVPLRGAVGSLGQELDEDADAEWVGGWHDLHV